MLMIKHGEIPTTQVLSMTHLAQGSEDIFTCPEKEPIFLKVFKLIYMYILVREPLTSVQSSTFLMWMLSYKLR